ncbi:response regulator transcription factor [Salegentibacter chungangensis]|uniref:Response regulator transcription factor n=1 Tax=Salegentibacter chungangensis TaxID=1335724 RepID=A0ABW3NQP7_9FLAO
MSEDTSRIFDLWKKEYSKQIKKYSEYEAKDQFQQFASLFTPGNSYFYILNLHNLNLDYISPEVEIFTGKPPEEVTMECLLQTALKEEFEWIEKKERLIQSFYNDYLPSDKVTDYKMLYSYEMKDHKGNKKVMLIQGTPLSVSENGTPQHLLVIHSDVSHLQVCSIKEVSFISLKGEKSFYNLDPENGCFNPELCREEHNDLANIITKREQEIIKYLAKGLNAEEIAEKLNISKHTIRTHRKNILQKTGCNNTTQLVAKCLTGGIITPQDL